MDTKQCTRSMNGIKHVLENENVSFVKLYKSDLNPNAFYAEITTKTKEFNYTSAKSLFHLFEGMSRHIPEEEEDVNDY